MVKAFFEELIKRLGERAADLVWAALIIGFPVLAWFTAPDVYTFRLTRLIGAPASWLSAPGELTLCKEGRLICCDNIEIRGVL